MKKMIYNLLIAISLIVLSLLYVFLAKQYNAFFFSFYPAISIFITKIMSYMTSFTSFSLWEFLTVIIIVLLIVDLIIHKEVFLWFSKIILVVSIIAHLFIFSWGLNYYAPTLFERLNLENRSYTAEELKEATDYFLDKANYYSETIQRNTDGEAVLDFKEQLQKATDGYEKIEELLNLGHSSKIRAKQLVSSSFFGRKGTTGIFICITGESCVSTTVFDVAMPYTAAHEIAHRYSIAREDEANFIAFLACINSEDPLVQYSAYYEAFLFSYNALYAADSALFEEVKSRIGDSLRSDLLRSIEHYEKIEDPVAVENNNDLYEDYLNAFDIEGGVETYREVIQLLLSWYYQNIH